MRRQRFLIILAISFVVTTSLCVNPDKSANAQEFLGELSANPYNPQSLANPYGAGSQFNPKSPNNPFSAYGSPFSPKSATNPYTNDAPRLYDQDGQYRGKLSANPYDPDSTSNPFGRYGSPFSPDSINNPYGAASPFAPNSPNNPFAPKGWSVIGK